MARSQTNGARRGVAHAVRRQVGNVLIDGFFQLGSAAWRSLPLAHPARHGIVRTVDVPYRSGGDRAHLLDVYRPGEPSTTPRPAVLYVHGGSFRILSKESHFMMATEFAKAGYVVFNMNYRLAPRHPFPAALEDVAEAWRWVVENAARWGADPARLIVSGESAGGNLTVALAIMATYERPEAYARRVYSLGVIPKAIVPLCGILQVTRHSRGSKRLPALIQDRIDAAGEYYLGLHDATHAPERALADPIVILESGRPARAFPPAFASAGTRDPIHADTLRLQRVLDAWGVPCDARLYRGEPHAFQALTFRRAVREQWRALFDFLAARV
jgi:acetyl esterase